MKFKKLGEKDGKTMFKGADGCSYYKKGVSFFKAEDDSKYEGEAEEDGEEDGEEDEEKAGKSIPVEDLEKALVQLERFSKGDGPGRREELLEKAQKGKLAKSEADELYQILAGTRPGDETDVGEPLSKALTAGLEENEEMEKAIDVSGFLGELRDELTKSLTVLGDAVEAGEQREHAFNLVLAKALASVGNLVKAQTVALDAIQSRLGIIEAQPARKPKSQLTGVQPLEKGMAGGRPAGAGDELTKGQILDALDEMLEKSVNEGGSGSIGGESLTLATAKLESAGTISPSLLNAVRAHLKNRAA